MKFKFSFLLFLSFASIAFCQDPNKEIETRFLTYNDLIIHKEFEKAMDFAPVELFTIAPKSMLIAVMEKTMNNPEMTIQFDSTQIKKIGSPEKIGNKYYALIEYVSPMHIKLNSVGTNEKPTDRKLLKTVFSGTFGEGNVQYDEKTDFFHIKAQKQAYAIANDGASDWKFVVVDLKQRTLLAKLLPKDLVDRTFGKQ